jgi:alpha-tubulin suppressor-like RCC1 family protein
MQEVQLRNVSKVASWATLGGVVLALGAVVSAVVVAIPSADCPGLGPEPVQPKSGAVPDGGFLRLSAGGTESCAQARSGQLWCWGRGEGLSRRPQLLPLGERVPFEVLAVHELGFCTVDSAHVARCERRLGSEIDSELVPWFELPHIRRVVLGARHGCALGDDDSLWCFGYNDAGQLPGFTPGSWSGTPVRVLSGVSDVALGARHTCVVTRSGQVRCWGDNSSGQSGREDAAPLELPGAAQQLALGDSHSCALLLDGQVFCWGRDLIDQRGPYAKVRGPHAIGLSGGASALASSENTTCALLGPDRLSCWGQTYGCALGDYFCSTHDSTTPRSLRVPGEATALALGDQHACVLLRSGNVACVGSNRESQLGSVLPFAPVTHSAFHSVGCDTEAWEKPPGWPELLPLIW